MSISHEHIKLIKGKVVPVHKQPPRN